MDKPNRTKYGSSPTDKTVSRFDNCPCFDGRKSLLAIEPICWFCKYAKFDQRRRLVLHEHSFRVRCAKLR